MLLMASIISLILYGVSLLLILYIIVDLFKGNSINRDALLLTAVLLLASAISKYVLT